MVRALPALFSQYQGALTMQLSFLGKTYTASFPALEAAETQETGTFLGKQYIKKQFHVSDLQHTPARMTYRGVRYIR
jgi:hypothetical protein